MDTPNKVLRPGQAPLGQSEDAQGRNLLQAIQMETAPEAAPLMMFFANNARLLMAGLGIFIIVLVGFGIFNYTAKKALNAARDDLSKVLQETDPAIRSKNLEDFIRRSPSGTLVASYLALAKSQEEQQKYPQAAEAWAKVAEIAEDPMRVNAIIGQATALASNQEFGKAQDVLEKLLAEVKDNKNYLLLLNSMIADMAERNNDNKRAVEACRAILTLPNIDNEDFWRARMNRLSATPKQAPSASGTPKSTSEAQ